MQHLEGSGTPVVYIGRTVLKGQQRQILKISSVYSYTTAYTCISRLGNRFRLITSHHRAVLCKGRNILPKCSHKFLLYGF